ncbi:uncharacterized protein TNCV_3366711 [Trichonephila clavipes]|nr:uncharacterized protein TNCV_3366711 [Trichonephila clavipes]
MDVCKCIVPLRHGGTLNSRRAASPLVWLVEGEKRWEAPDHAQGFLLLNWGRLDQNHAVTCMVLKAKANDRLVSPSHSMVRHGGSLGGTDMHGVQPLPLLGPHHGQ